MESAAVVILERLAQVGSVGAHLSAAPRIRQALEYSGSQSNRSACNRFRRRVISNTRWSRTRLQSCRLALITVSAWTSGRVSPSSRNRRACNCLRIKHIALAGSAQSATALGGPARIALVHPLTTTRQELGHSAPE